MSTSLTVVIPTRNRADLAIAAVRSLLAISDPRLRHVIVSNNSSEAGHVQQLEELCRASQDARLVHIRPSRDLPMAEHWDWATQEALVRSDATHVALHYDRRISGPELRLLLDVIDRWPEHPITYRLDMIYPDEMRFRVSRMTWSGHVYEIRTAQAVQLASRGRLTELWQMFPVLVNCAAPRAVIERVRRRFRDVCASTSPESCFGFRVCAVEQRYLHFDRSLGIHYAFARSNGIGYLRNETSGTFGDFVRLFGDRPWLDAAPLPGLSLGQNSFYHEYGRVRREATEANFPPIEMSGYLNDLAQGLVWISDPARRAEMRELLVKHGWRDERPAAAAGAVPRMLSRLRRKLGRTRSAFRREDEALRHAQEHPLAPVPENDFLTPLQPVRLDLS